MGKSECTVEVDSRTGRGECASAPRTASRFLRAAQRIFATTEEAIEVLDSRFNVLAVNHAYARLTGLDCSECIGRRSVVLGAIQGQRKLNRNVLREVERSGIWQGEIVIAHTSEGPSRVCLLLKELDRGTGYGCRYLAVLAATALRPAFRQRVLPYRESHGTAPLRREQGLSPRHE